MDYEAGSTPLGTLAVFTEAVKFQFVGLNRKPVFSGDLFLQIFDLAILKFDYFSAGGANEVIMMTFMRHIIELRLGAEMTFLCQVGFTE